MILKGDADMEIVCGDGEQCYIEGDEVHFVGIRQGVRSYDLGDGIVICAQESIRVYVHRDGKRTVYSYRDHGDEAKCRLLILGMGLSMLMCFRGFVPIHASYIMHNNMLYAFVAKSGVGKTTMATSCVEQRGSVLISDDVLPVMLHPDGSVLGVPSSSLPVKAWQSDLMCAVEDLSGCEEIYPGIGKYYVLRDDYVQPHRVGAIFILDPDDSMAEGDVRLRGLEKHSGLTILSHIHAIWAYPRPIYGQLFMQFSSISDRIPVYGVSYRRTAKAMPRILETVYDVIDRVSGEAQHMLG